jgi:hypothetical protein
MKNKLLPLFLVLGMYTAQSQVGIGTKTPSSAAQLEITNNADNAAPLYGGSTKGLLIPRVKLTNTTIYAPIVGTQENSLLVFNTQTINDVTPGYYYWYVDKWMRLGTSADSGSGTPGIAGGNGAPGAAGTPGIDGSIKMYIDNVTNIVYVRDPNDPTKWIPINGKDGKDGVAGAPGLAAGPGAPGATGTSGAPGPGVTTWIDTTTGDIYIKDADGNWVKINGNDGKDGLPGGPGVPGKDATPPAGVSIWVDTNTKIVYIKDPATGDWIQISGNNGKDGLNGASGLTGGNGVPGAPGTPGIDGSIKMYVDNVTGIVYVRDPNDPTKWIPLNGKDGKDGIAGAPGLAAGPGAPGATGTAGAPGPGVTTWIDTTTGDIYI